MKKRFGFKRALAAITAAVMFSAYMIPPASAENGTQGYTVSDGKSRRVSVSKPAYTLSGVKGGRHIVLTTETSGAVIYYTLDGTTPTVSGKKYTGEIIIKKDTKIKAIAVKDGVKSAVMTKTVSVATKLGDVTGDGNINKNDSARLSDYLGKGSARICTDNADVNSDGKVNSDDLSMLENYIDGKIKSFGASVSKNTTVKNITVEPVSGTSGVNSREGFENIFDGSTRTKWCVSGSSAYVIFKLSSAASIKGMSFTTANDNSIYKGRNPSTFAVYGSNASKTPSRNDKSWELAAYANNNTILKDTNYTKYDLVIPKESQAYKYYMLDVVSTQGADCMQISEFALSNDGKYTFTPANPVNDSDIPADTSGSGGGGFDVVVSPTLYNTRVCNVCRGSGRRTCLSCNGNGYFQVSRRRCTSCNGAGTKICSMCGGDGLY